MNKKYLEADEKKSEKLTHEHRFPRTGQNTVKAAVGCIWKSS